MAEIVNLRAARKRRSRADQETAAAANRARFGQRRADKDNEALNSGLADKRLDAHLRVPAGSGDDEG